MRIFVVLAVFAALTACAVREIKVAQVFDATAAKQAMRPGANTLKGSALMRQRGGVVVTCAGSEVTLIPASRYSEEWLLAYLGPGKFADEYRPLPLHLAPAEFGQAMHRTTCNALGFFQFDNVADGDFILHTVITWSAGRRSYEGGTLTTKVSLAGGKTVDLTLAP